MVYGLLKHRIKYAEKEGVKKMDEFWINYCGMPVCCRLKEFTIVMGLSYDRLEEPLIKKTPQKGSNKYKVKKDGLLGIVGRSNYKAVDLMADLEDKDIPMNCREKFCLVLFVHFVLLARDFRKVIEDDLLGFANDFDRFNDYPWGYDNYYLTVQYLLIKLSTGTITLYNFPWAFMIKLITIFTHPLIYNKYTGQFEG
ncbi:hypothetical protein FXO38_28614 [Capsicum annuum]|nr:hypothetical protein FXO38_28614 [Capsicum annuum]KAF3629697.1 hypothetical protein FXO37_28812 [Capsicum annuum]